MHLGTRSLTLTVDGVSRTADVSDCRIVSAPIREDMQKICGPTREYWLQGVAAQDPSVGSLWDLVWDHADEEVGVDLRPAGGVVASGSEPSFVGTVTITEPDGDMLGGRADPSSANRFVFEINWPFTAKPTRVTA